MDKWLIGAGAVMVVVMYIMGLKMDIAKKELKEIKAESFANWSRAENLQSVLEKERTAAAEMAKTETEIAERLRNANEQIDSLRSDVDAGRRQLRIKATCPPAERMPEAAAADSRDDGASPRLERDAEQAHWDLREQNEQVIHQVLLLQAYATACSNQAPVTKGEKRPEK